MIFLLSALKLSAKQHVEPQSLSVAGIVKSSHAHVLSFFSREPSGVISIWCHVVVPALFLFGFFLYDCMGFCVVQVF